MSIHHLYWIRLPEHKDIFTQGYVGVTKQKVERRFSDHVSEYRRGVKGGILSCAFKKYGVDDLIVETVIISDKPSCYEYENKLRPRPRVGWNTMIGGQIPTGGGYKHSDEMVEAGYKLYMSGEYSSSQIEKYTGIGINYHSYLFYGKKRDNFKASTKRRDLSTLPRLKYSDGTIFDVYDLYYKDNLHIQDIVEITGISASYIRSLVQGQKCACLLEIYKQEGNETNRRNTRISFSEKDVVEDYLNGLTVAQIVEKYSSAKTTIRGVLKRNNMKFKQNKVYTKGFLEPLYEDYFLKGVSVDKISEVSGIGTKYLRALFCGYKRKKMYNKYKDMKAGLNNGVGSGTAKGGDKSSMNMETVAKSLKSGGALKIGKDGYYLQQGDVKTPLPPSAVPKELREVFED